jgi:ATP-dependent helicase/nuclease subunit A
MALAQEKGMLYREMPFVTGMKADRLKDSWDPGETVLVQGIIDAYFFEEDGIVLVDYKTDRALEGDEESLVRRYQTQFDLYREALESLTGKRVKESFLYSLSLGRALPVPAREEKQEKTD